jgi:hypothetical protein
MRIGTSFLGAWLGACVCVYGCGTDAKKSNAVEQRDAGQQPDDLTPTSSDPDALPSDASEACHLHTQFPGDSVCLKPPADGTGIQVHVGPTNYDDADEVKPFLLDPGKEITECFYVKTTNDEPAYYFPRKFRMRPGSHHLISNFIDNKTVVPDGWGPCDLGDRRGSLGGAEKSMVDYPNSVPVAEENLGLGKLLPRNTVLKIELHHINQTDKPILREAWINVYWKPKEQITQYVQDMFMLGGTSLAVPPGGHQVVHNACTIGGDTRILDIFGHFHAHTTRFSAWRTRGDQKELFYEVFDWHDTPTISYDSKTKNGTPSRDDRSPGGMSGLLDIQKGDTLEWECEIENTTGGTLHFANQLNSAEMCNLFGTYASNSAALLMCARPGEITNL